MAQPEIELVCSQQDRGADVLRLNLRRAIISAGYLPHWKESFGEASTQAIIKINRKKIWEGTIKEFNELEPEKQVLLLKENERQGFHWKRFLKVQASFFTALIIAFFPKCPFCWAAYMSLFSSLGLGKFAYQPWLLPVFVVLLFLNIVSLYLSRKRHGYKPMVLALTGAIIITFNRMYWNHQEIMFIGAIFLITASLWNSLPKRMIISLKYYFFHWVTKTN
jgi:mercuric ion transport protein